MISDADFRLLSSKTIDSKSRDRNLMFGKFLDCLVHLKRIKLWFM